MFFRNIIFAGIIAGIFAGFALGLIQYFSTTSTIISAEVFEVSSDDVAADGHTHSHGADGEAWAPEDGAERTFFTFFSDVLAGIGFAVLLISIMVFSGKSNIKNGWMWGVAGFLTFYFAPTFGLVPEIPGMEAANLQGRQGWWMMTVLLTGLSLWLIAFGHTALKVGGIILLALPHIIGAPLPETHGFANPDPAAVAALEDLALKFKSQAMIANGVFWLILGIASGVVVDKFKLIEK